MRRAISNHRMRRHSGVVHINDQTVVHGVYGLIGGVGASGNGSGHGTVSNADQFSDTMTRARLCSIRTNKSSKQSDPYSTRSAESAQRLEWRGSFASKLGSFFD
jgi:hypothetical protein